MITTPVEASLTNYLYTKASRNGMPLSGTFELTPCCNMACKMCYVRKTKEEQEKIAPLRTAKEWLELGKTAREQGMLYLLLTGGEPFLRPDFQEILSGLHRMGLLISINSNGTLIDEETVEWLKETPPVRINITLYGASDETYARLCGNPKGFTQTARAIRLLKEAGIQVKINCSVTPYNVDDLEGIYAFAREEGLLVQATSYMFPPLRRDTFMVGQNDRFSPQEAAYQSACILALDLGEDEFLRRVSKDESLAFSQEIEEDCPEIDGEGDGIRCRAGKCSFWITWDGRMLPCGMFPEGNAQNVFQIGFEKAWKQVHEEALAIRLPAKCSGCTLRDQCKACAAMVMTESGNFHTVPEYRCKMAKAHGAACRQKGQEILDKRGLKS
jgi:MoaA/NifB/PqqE/SkfB family radical SAM enzyme